jgi:hypothetical protein
MLGLVQGIAGPRRTLAHLLLGPKLAQRRHPIELQLSAVIEQHRQAPSASSSGSRQRSAAS